MKWEFEFWVHEDIPLKRKATRKYSHVTVLFFQGGWEGVFKPAIAYLFSQNKILAKILLLKDQVSSLWLFASQNLWIQ